MYEPVVGREAELAQLTRWWERVRGGARHLVCITGEAGIGKTTLIDTWLASAGGRGASLDWHGQCVEQFGAGEPYRPVLEAFGRLGRGPHGQEVVARPGAQAPTWLVQMPGLIPADDLEALLGRRMGGATRERMVREVAEALEVLTVQQPVVLVLEDLHWSDPTTPGPAARPGAPPGAGSPAAPVHVSAPRSAAPGPSPGGRAPRTAPAQPQRGIAADVAAEQAAIAAYLSRRLRGLPCVDALARLVHQHTEGNPLFMLRLVEAWLTQGVLREQDGTRRLLAALGTLHQLQESPRQLIDEPLDRLSATEQRSARGLRAWPG